MNKYVAILILCVIFVSCDYRKRIHPLNPEDMEYVFDRHGRVKDYNPDLTGKKVMSFGVIGAFIFNLQNAPSGKIDQIIADNPDWEFIYYVYGDLKDSTIVMNALDKYDCDFPIVYDINNKFRKKNGLGIVSLIGFICDEKDAFLGGSIIGAKIGMFDTEFRYAKREINARKRKKKI